MKKTKKLSLAIIVAVLVILSGCSKSVDKTVNTQQAESTIASEGSQYEKSLVPSSNPTPTQLPSPTPAPTPSSTPTQEPAGEQAADNESKLEGPYESMADISDAYMRTVEIIEDCPANVMVKKTDVAYGTVVHNTYESKTTGLTRGVNIILPPNYDESKKYPVVYLLHGIFGNEHSMLDGNSKLIEISGNLAAEGKAKEMIIVLPDMFAKTDANQQPDLIRKACLFMTTLSMT